MVAIHGLRAACSLCKGLKMLASNSPERRDLCNKSLINGVNQSLLLGLWWLLAALVGIDNRLDPYVIGIGRLEMQASLS